MTDMLVFTFDGEQVCPELTFSHPSWKCGGPLVVVVRMARGYRVYESAAAQAGRNLKWDDLWQPSHSSDKRFPKLTTVRAWLAMGGRP